MREPPEGVRLESEVKLFSVGDTAVWLAANGTLPIDVPLSDADKVQMAKAIRDRGLNCPTISTMRAEVVDARGIVYRVTCAIPSGTMQWDVRYIDRQSLIPKFEPW